MDKKNSKKQLPPYGKHLAEKISWGNLPFLSVVCIGLNAWERAKQWNETPNQSHAMVLDAEMNPVQMFWPVENCIVLIEWDIGPSDSQIIKLVRTLQASGSLQVIVQPIFVNIAEPSEVFDLQEKKWIKVREKLHIYSTPIQQVDVNAA